MTTVRWGDLIADAHTSGLCVPYLTAQETHLNAALSYADAGWFVLPVKKGTKNPGSIVGSKWPEQSSRDAKRIRAWFHGTDHQIALHVGRSGAVAFDVDTPARLPKALRQQLMSNLVPFQQTRPEEHERGHYLFSTGAHRFGNSVGALGQDWGDVRGENGVILAAPSIHPSGGAYRWVRTGTLPEIPTNLAAMIPSRSYGPVNMLHPGQIEALVKNWSREDEPSLLDVRMKALQRKPKTEGTRHRIFLQAAMTCMKDSRVGLYAATRALERLKHEFDSVKPFEQQTPDEFLRIAGWAICVVSELPDEDMNLHILSSRAVSCPQVRRWLERHSHAH